jgi:hypothetical protein
MTQLNLLEIAALLVVFLAILLVATRGSWRARPGSRRRKRNQDQHILDETGPYEVPEEDAPSRQDD